MKQNIQRIKDLVESMAVNANYIYSAGQLATQTAVILGEVVTALEVLAGVEKQAVEAQAGETQAVTLQQP